MSCIDKYLKTGNYQISKLKYYKILIFNILFTLKQILNQVTLMEIDYINGPKTDKIFGMSKYQMEIHKRLDVNLNVIEYNSLTHFFEKKYSDDSKSRTDSPDSINIPFLSRSLNYIMDIGKITLKTIDKYRYIPIVKNKVKEGNIKHITSQELAFLLNSVNFENVIVTCYDLIPVVYDRERSFIWKENMNGA